MYPECKDIQTWRDTSPQSLQDFLCQLMLLLISFLPSKDASSSASRSVRTSAWTSFWHSSVSFFKDDVKAQGQETQGHPPGTELAHRVGAAAAVDGRYLWVCVWVCLCMLRTPAYTSLQKGILYQNFQALLLLPCILMIIKYLFWMLIFWQRWGTIAI